MIYTVTFNPAIDYVVRMDRLEPGSINRASQELIQFGGKGINVSTVLGNLGTESGALGFLAGFTGRAIEAALKRGLRVELLLDKDGTIKVQTVSRKKLNIVPTP